MSALRSLEEFIYGPDADRKQGLVSTLPEILKLAKEQQIKNIEIEIRKIPPGAASSQEGTERISADSDPEEVAAALLKRLQEAPGESFKGALRLNFRESGRTANNLRSFQREMSGGTSSIGADKSGMVPYETYHAALEDNRRTMDAGIRMMNGVANMTEKLLTFVNNVVNPNNTPAKNQDLLTKTLGVVAMGLQDPAKGAAEAAKVLEAESRPIQFKASPSSSSSPAPAPAPEAKPPYEFGEEEAERWARANPDKAKSMAMKLMQEGL